MEKVYKVSVSVPPEFADPLMDEIAVSTKRVVDGYERAFSIIDIKGTWRTLEGSSPYNGEPGKITVADEKRLEFLVWHSDLKNAVDAILRVHPYEEPAIDIVEEIYFKSL